MRLRLSACGGLFWNNGHLVWDDYLEHRQFALADGAERVLRLFHDWRELGSIGDKEESSRYELIAEHFLRNDILIEFGSARHEREQAVLESWGAWGPLTRAFHFSTRYHRDAKFRTVEQQAAELHEKVVSEPPPAAYKQYPDAQRVGLPEWRDTWRRRDLIDVLYERRSCREFGDAPVTAEQLAAILQVAGGPIKMSEAFQTVQKTSPSGGGRHPTEIYACVRNVAGVHAGLYHYDGAANELERIGPLLDDAELVKACGDQEWVADAGVVLFYTSVISRNQWKYANIARSYRVLLLDAGHLSQTVYLLTTALGLGITFTAACRDEIVEEYLGCDPVTEAVIGCAAIGSVADQPDS